MRRVKITMIRPNKLFETWLEEWRDEAAARNSELQYHFSKALEALRKYPLPLETGRDCIILQHFGSKLCAMIDKKLELYLAEEEESQTPEVDVEQKIMEVDDGDDVVGGVVDDVGGVDEVDEADVDGVDDDVDAPEELKANEAIVISDDELVFDETDWATILPDDLHNNPARDEPSCSKYARMDKVDEELMAIPGCSKDARIAPLEEEAMSRPGCSKDARIAPLEEEVMSRAGCSKDARIAPLEEEVMSRPGCSRGARIAPLDEEPMNVPSRSGSYETPVDIPDEPIVRESSFSIRPKSFDVILLVDIQEVKGSERQNAVTQRLTREGVKFEIRHLHIGDFLWIARCNETKRELVMPYIVERKRMDDFASSIKDGRYHEQKFRLRHCGIPNVIYMVEKLPGGNAHLSLPMSTLMQASMNSMVQDNFTIKFTKDHRDSLLYLSTVTQVIERVFKDKLLNECDKESLPEECNVEDREVYLMDFEKFNKTSAKVKPLTVKEMFVNHLVQIKGLSLDGALAIVERYPTPSLLKKAFDAAGDNGEKLLATLQYGRTKRKLGPVLAKIIHQLYTKEELS